jgi:hypothetical protein
VKESLESRINELEQSNRDLEAKADANANANAEIEKLRRRISEVEATLQAKKTRCGEKKKQLGGEIDAKTKALAELTARFGAVVDENKQLVLTASELRESAQAPENERLTSLVMKLRSENTELTQQVNVMVEHLRVVEQIPKVKPGVRIPYWLVALVALGYVMK